MDLLAFRVSITSNKKLRSYDFKSQSANWTAAEFANQTTDVSYKLLIEILGSNKKTLVVKPQRERFKIFQVRNW